MRTLIYREVSSSRSAIIAAIKWQLELEQGSRTPLNQTNNCLWDPRINPAATQEAKFWGLPVPESDLEDMEEEGWG